MEKVVTLDKLIIFPNLGFKEVTLHKFIISARGFVLVQQGLSSHPIVDYYIAGTDDEIVHRHFWNDTLSNEDKAPAILHMLKQLHDVYGFKFGYILPNKNLSNEL